MIDPDRRNAIYQLHLAGTPQAHIARQFHLSPHTVRAIIREQGAMPQTVRKDKIHIDPDLLRRLYQQCDGRIQRVHEILVEDEKVRVSYPTLTRRVRELELGKPSKARCDHVPDEPGVEMQHDTTVYRVKLADKPAGHRQPAVPAVLEAAVLEVLPRVQSLRYEVFPARGVDVLGPRGQAVRDRQHQPGGVARQRQAGGDRARNGRLRRALRLPIPLPCDSPPEPKSRRGEKLLDCGNQLPAGPQLPEPGGYEPAGAGVGHGADGASPGEQDAIDPRQGFRARTPLSDRTAGPTPAPYWPYERGTDEYGYVAVEGNYYWVPGTKREDVKVLRYADRLKIYRQRTCVAEYPLPADGIKNARFSPEGQPLPRHLPKHRHHGSQHEEQRLRGLGSEVAAYVDFALQTPAIQRHRFLRELFVLSRQVTPSVFVEALTRALRYRVVQMETLHRIAWLCMSQGQQPLPSVDEDEDFRQRPAYEEGFLTDEPDLSVYDETPPEDRAVDEPESEDQDG